jgi:TolB-like protein
MYTEAPAGSRPGWFGVLFFCCFLAVGGFLIYRDLTRPDPASERPTPEKPAPEKDKEKDVPQARPPAPNSVAVVPFVTLMTDDTRVAFDQMVLSALVSALFKQEGLVVTPLSASLGLRSKEKGAIVTGGPAEAGRKLGVAFVLTGTAAHDWSSGVPVHYELIRVADGALVWSSDLSQRENRPLNPDAAAKIAAEVRGKILGK